MLSQKPIISFTEAAALHIKKTIAADPKNIGFRLSVKKSGCVGFAYMPDIIREASADDIHFIAEHGISVYIDPQSVDIIKNTLVDFIDKGAWQKQLIFNHPKLKNQCGCGESFSIEEGL